MAIRPVQSNKKSGDIYISASVILFVYYYDDLSELHSNDNADDANGRKYWVSTLS